MFYKEIKIWQVTDRSWLIIFTFTNLALFSLNILSLCLQSWVYLDLKDSEIDELNFKPSSFKGGVITCYSGCGSEKTYKEYFDSNECASYDSPYPNLNSSAYSICKMIDNLAVAGEVKIAFDALALFGILTWTITMYCLWFTMKVKCLNLTLSVISPLSSFLGTIVWFGKSDSSEDNCGLDDRSLRQQACFDHGPKLGVSVTVLMFFFGFLYFYVFYKILEIYKNDGKQIEDKIKKRKQLEVVPKENQVFSVVGDSHRGGDLDKPQNLEASGQSHTIKGFRETNLN